MSCDLCASAGRLTLAFLRRPWSGENVIVKACTGCAAIAWRTVDDDAAHIELMRLRAAAAASAHPPLLLGLSHQVAD